MTKTIQLMRADVSLLALTDGQRRVERTDVLEISDADWASFPAAQKALFDILRDGSVEDRLDDAGDNTIALTTLAAIDSLTAATVATAAGSDPATTQALANALKTAVNAIIADNVTQTARLAQARVDILALWSDLEAMRMSLAG